MIKESLLVLTLEGTELAGQRGSIEVLRAAKAAVRDYFLWGRLLNSRAALGRVLRRARTRERGATGWGRLAKTASYLAQSICEPYRDESFHAGCARAPHEAARP